MQLWHQFISNLQRTPSFKPSCAVSSWIARRYPSPNYRWKRNQLGFSSLHTVKFNDGIQRWKNRLKTKKKTGQKTEAAAQKKEKKCLEVLKWKNVATAFSFIADPIQVKKNNLSCYIISGWTTKFKPQHKVPLLHCSLKSVWGLPRKILRKC